MEHRSAFVGTAGWGIASRHAAHFPAEGTHLERYAERLCCAEINSSFYRPHRPQTYARWAASVPEDFRFSVKLPKAITHEKRLRDCRGDIGRFIAAAGCLGDKLGVVLVQTPPSLAFRPSDAACVLETLRTETAAGIAVEPRHRSWFCGEADALMRRLDVARVAADPAPLPDAGQPGGFPGLTYFRFHGSPEIYRSDYPPPELEQIGRRMEQAFAAGANDVWCIFDNTAEGHALENALAIARCPAPAGHRGQP